MLNKVKVDDSEIPFIQLVRDKEIMGKVIPMLNVMYSQHLSIDEGISLIDLAWRLCTSDIPAPAAKKVKTFMAEPGKTVVQEIRKYYAQRPFNLFIDGLTISIPYDITMTAALMKGMNEQLEFEREQRLKSKAKKPVSKTIISSKPAAPTPVSEPAPAPVIAAQPAIVEPEDEPDDEDIQPQLKTYEVNPGEAVSRAVARVWPLRPCNLMVNGKCVYITATMGLVDAQIEAAEAAEVDGNHADETEEEQPVISPAGVVLRNDVPFAVADFEYSIPVDDSRWNISNDRFSDAPFVRTSRAVWLDGYPYRISCVPFEELMNTQLMFYVHCKEQPSQEMFDVYHALFRRHTHKVHVRKSNFTQDGSEIITHQYCSWRPREQRVEQVSNVVSTVMEALGLNARWEPGAKYRIRYWDTNVNCVNHRYYAQRPSDQALATLRHPKLKPVIQTRPAGI